MLSLWQLKQNEIPPNDEEDGWWLNWNLQFTHSNEKNALSATRADGNGTAQAYVAQPIDGVDLAVFSHHFATHPVVSIFQQRSN